MYIFEKCRAFKFLMFHNNILKISEKLNKRNLLKIRLQVTYPTPFCIKGSVITKYEKMIAKDEKIRKYIRQYRTIITRLNTYVYSPGRSTGCITNLQRGFNGHKLQENDRKGRENILQYRTITTGT